MLIAEAKWLHEQIRRIGPQKIYPILNIGSSTKKFIHEIQPWIGEFLFRPGEKYGGVICVDQKRGEGVDIVGDLMNDNFLRCLKQYQFKSILLSNVLEHVRDRRLLCRRIEMILPADGYLLVSCPYEYPFHMDPIDTGYRPTPSEITNLFPKLTQVSSEIVKCQSFSGYLFRNKKSFIRSLVLLMIPFYKPKEWINRLMNYLWMFRRFSASCVVINKKL